MLRGIGRKLLLATAAVTCVLAVALAFLIPNWPFTRASSVDRLQNLMNAQVEVTSFRQTYFPYAGYIAEGLTFRKQLSPGAPPQVFMTIKRLTVQAGYFGLFHKPHRLSTVVADGAHIVIPGGGINLTSQDSGKSDPVSIAELRIEQAVLDIASSSHEPGPLTFKVHSARFLNVGANSTVAFSSSVRIPEPPAEVETKGWIGPWRDDQGTVRSTPISGSYVLRGGNLAHYQSLMGVFSSDGEFSGTLAQLKVKGSTSSPDFGVRESKHHFRLNTRFAGSVDLRNGDVNLPTFQAGFGKTELAGSVKVAGNPKTTGLNVVRGKGFVEDLVLLFSDAPRSPIVGPIVFSTETALPPGNASFTERVRLAGRFNIAPAHFTSYETQEGVDKLSADSRGEHSELAEDNDALSELEGNVALEKGIARFPQVKFRVPGATAKMAGTYSFLNRHVDFGGKMHMEATLSQATTGVKSVLLKVLDPFFKGKHSGAVLPVAMQGPYGNTKFSVGLRSKD